MKRVLLHLFALLPLIAVAAQSAGVTNSPPRDASGFLVAPNQPAQPRDVAAAPAPTPPLASPTVESAATSAAANASLVYTLDDKHKLLAGDKVSFQIVEDRTNAIPLLVAESAELDVPYIGRINVAQKTCKELAAEVKGMLEKDYYIEATVIIGLDTLSKVLGKVYVWGPVKLQGPVEIPSNESFTAGKAILRQGGFGDFADKKNVKVVRKTPTGNVTLKVNMVDVLEKGKTEADIVLQPEDFIIVPQRAINW